MLVFVETTLQARRTWICTIFFGFFNIFKYIKNAFQIKDAYAPKGKKSLSRSE
jgi:hypothetical protein